MITHHAQVLRDLCVLLDGAENTNFLRVSSISTLFLLDTIDSILNNFARLIPRHPELLEACRVELMPRLAVFMQLKNNFAVGVRAVRIMLATIRRHFMDMIAESTQAWMIILRCVEPDQAIWRRSLSMEAIRFLLSDASLVRNLFREVDLKGKQHPLRDTMAVFVRLASEKGSLIGLAQQSTIPSRRGTQRDVAEEMAVIEASGVGGVIGNAALVETTATGISMEWSMLEKPCLELLDKQNPPEIPDTYIYALVLNCVSIFAEGIAKFVMPLSLPSRSRPSRQDASIESRTSDDNTALERTSSQTTTRSRSENYQLLTNPLANKSHAQHATVVVISALLDECWPAFLATCSTFLNAALDVDFYHNLVRAFQKLTQVSGILELATPRDAMLTSLGKAAVPVETSKRIQSHSKAKDVPLSDVKPSQVTLQAMRDSLELNRQPSMSTRNLLCLRALLNLGIALGPTLPTDTWYILLETLQQAEGIMEISKMYIARQTQKDGEKEASNNIPKVGLGAEIAAVETASKRLLESTTSYNPDSFKAFLSALLRISGQDEPPSTALPSRANANGSFSVQKQRGRMHQSSRSISVSRGVDASEDEIMFVLAKIRQLAAFNIDRFLQSENHETGWDTITSCLLSLIRVSEPEHNARLYAAKTLCLMVEATTKAADRSDAMSILSRSLLILKTIIACLHRQGVNSAQSVTDCEIHQLVMTAISTIFNDNGDDLSDQQWTIIFEIISTVFIPPDSAQYDVGPKSLIRSEQLMKQAFTCLQTISSEFLSQLSEGSILPLLDLVKKFGEQDVDLNVSLTSITMLSTLASHIRSRRSDTAYSDENSRAFAPELWTTLMHHLSELAVNPRAEVRSSSIKSITQILDATTTCMHIDPFNKIVFGAIMPLLKSHAQATQQISNATTQPEWLHTLNMLVSGTSGFVGAYLIKTPEPTSRLLLALKIMDLYELVLQTGRYQTSREVLAATDQLLTAMNMTPPIESALLEKALVLWLLNHPADFTDIDSDIATIQDACAQHTSLFVKAFGMMPESLRGQLDLKRILEALNKTIFECRHAAYTSDLVALAPEQKEVVEALVALASCASDQQTFVNYLVGFCTSAIGREISNEPRRSPAQRPTLIAFSAECIRILTKFVLASGNTVEKIAIIPACLKALGRLIETKYSLVANRQNSTLWRRGTDALVEILEHVTVVFKNSDSNGAANLRLIDSLCSEGNAAIIAILQQGGLESNDAVSMDEISDDEVQDAVSFRAAHAAHVSNLALSSYFGETSTAKDYVLALFSASLVSKPIYGDLPPEEFMISLRQTHAFSIITRMGTVCEPEYSIRAQIPFSALDALIHLMRVPDTSEGPTVTQDCRINLARVAAPYCLLRCTLPFRAFMADQPLRGPAMLPYELQRELLGVLSRLLELESWDGAFDDFTYVAGTRNSGRRHLKLLHPLFLDFSQCWRRCRQTSCGISWVDAEYSLGREIEAEMEEWLRFSMTMSEEP